MFIRMRGNQLAVTRMKKGMSVRALAKKANISHCYLSQIENRQRNPSPKIAVRLCQALEVDFDELFEVVEDRAALVG